MTPYHFCKNKSGKGFIVVIGVLIFIGTVGFAPHALAQSNFVPLAPITGLTDTATADSVANSNNLAIFFNNLYKYLIGLAAALAVIQIIWGGLEIAINKDNVSKITDSKGKIYNAILGLILVLAPVLVFSIINPRILDLGIGLSPLNTKPGNSTAAGGQPTATAPVLSSEGCTVTPGYFQKATCPTSKARDAWLASKCSNASSKVAGACATFNPDNSCADSTFIATCDTTSGPATGPYLFIDTSQAAGLSVSGVANLFTDSVLQPLVSTPSNQNNGNSVTQFVAQCQADKGVVCLGTSGAAFSSAFPTTCAGQTSVMSSSQVRKCYSLPILCRDPNSTGSSQNGCSNSNFTPIP